MIPLLRNLLMYLIMFNAGVIIGRRFEAHSKWMGGLFFAGFIAESLLLFDFIAACLLLWYAYKHGFEQAVRTRSG
jgi:hypothetical protein